MSEATEITACTTEDYVQLLDDLAESWDGRGVHHLHQAFLVQEFSSSASLQVESRFALF